MNLQELDNIKKIFVHGDCPDGMGSAMVLYDVFGIEPQFVMHHQNEYLNLKPSEGMLFCDIIPPDSGNLQGFIDKGTVVLDHHKGAKKIVKQFGSRGIFADEKIEPDVSGTWLAYREVFLKKGSRFNKKPEHYVKVADFSFKISLRDTWQTTYPQWDAGNAYSMALVNQPWEYWRTNIENGVYLTPEDVATGQELLEARRRKAKACAQSALRKTIKNYQVAIFEDPSRLTSDASEYLRQDGVNIAMGFKLIEKENLLYVSLRSDDTFDVSRFAKVFNGGGHTKSAAFSVSMIDNVFIFLLESLKEFLEQK